MSSSPAPSDRDAHVAAQSRVCPSCGLTCCSEAGCCYGEGCNPTAGLPDDLARVLRDQSIIVPQDQAVWELLAKWRNAPSNTASADLPEEKL